jgi:hypothetical protein
MFAKKGRNRSKKEKKHHMPDMCRAYDAYEAYEVWKGLFLTPSTARELLPPPAGGPPPSRREVWGRGNREFAECRRARDARPYNVAGNCNCEMHLQRWVASLQRLDVFATVGCTAVHRRGAHCAPVSYIAAPVNLNGYNNNVSSGRAKGYRGDRKAPISNPTARPKALTGEAQRPPSSREGDRPQAVEGVSALC